MLTRYAIDTVGGATRKETQKGPQTLDQVLSDMQAEADAALWTAQRNRFDKTITKAHLLARDKENCEGLEEGIEVLKAALTELMPAIEDTRDLMAKEKASLK